MDQRKKIRWEINHVEFLQITWYFIDFSRVTNLVCLSTLGEEGMMYQPGDHLYIYPENNADHVDKLLQRIECSFSKDDIVTVEQIIGTYLIHFSDFFPNNYG